MTISESWKREQNLVKQLERDIQFKEEQLQRALDANLVQREKNDMIT